MANKHQDKGYEQDPHGWYREPPEAVAALFNAVDFRDALIWDPCCGTGNTLDVAKRFGHETVGSDIVARGARHRFYRSNFLLATKWPIPPGDRPLSLVFNPPYNAPTGTSEGFIMKALDMVPFHRIAALVPANFPFGQTRFDELFARHRPSHIGFLSKRPSMPPGAEVDRLAAQGQAFKGGKQDFVWIVWTSGGPHRTEALWLDWREPVSPSLRRTRPGSRLPSGSAQSERIK